MNRSCGQPGFLVCQQWVGGRVGGWVIPRCSSCTTSYRIVELQYLLLVLRNGKSVLSLLARVRAAPTHPRTARSTQPADGFCFVCSAETTPGWVLMYSTCTSAVIIGRPGYFYFASLWTKAARATVEYCQLSPNQYKHVASATCVEHHNINNNIIIIISRYGRIRTFCSDVLYCTVGQSKIMYVEYCTLYSSDVVLYLQLHCVLASVLDLHNPKQTYSWLITLLTLS